MRVTSSMYYNNLYSSSNAKITRDLFDVNKQIASGLSIQYAHDDVATFSQTMELDNEITTLGQIKKSTENGQKISDQTDVILNDFETTLQRMQKLLVQAGNGTNDSTSLDAIASELKGMKEHLISLSNTSINGEYLFSGSAIDVKPINDDGTYNGNDVAMNSFLGSHTKQQYNLTGAELFLGEEGTVKKEITTNVVNKNLIQKYSQLQGPNDKDLDPSLTTQSSIRELMGDTDDVVDNVNKKHFFYIRGVKSNGDSFNKKIAMRDDEKVDELLRQIGDAYGNTLNNQVVNVSLTESGQIAIEDKLRGSSKLDFHMVGAVDFSGGDRANVENIDELNSGETDFKEIINPTNPPANDLYVKEFVKSSLDPAAGAASDIEGLLYDRVAFAKDGSTLSSNVSQIVKEDNSYAIASTKLSEVADLSQNGGTLNGTSFSLKGKDVNGKSFDVSVDLKDSGSTFTYEGQTYTIYGADEPREGVKADDMTYQQLTDVMNMVVADTLPVDDSATNYDKAVYDSKFSTNTELNSKGQITFKDLRGSSDTKAEIALFDSNSGNFADGAKSSVVSFNANNSLTVTDAKTDFFATIDSAITAVENYKSFPDAQGKDARNVGIENAMHQIDILQDHVYRSHSTVGAQSNSLSKALERTQLLETSTITLRSSVVDTDLAEASLKLNQLTTNYQAMLSTVGKVSKLSLVNFL